MKIPCNFRDWMPSPYKMPLRTEERGGVEEEEKKEEEDEERKVWKDCPSQL